MSFRVENSAANIGDEPHGAVGLLLLKRSAKPIDVRTLGKGASHPPRRPNGGRSGLVQRRPLRARHARWLLWPMCIKMCLLSRGRRPLVTNPVGPISQGPLVLRKATQERAQQFQKAGHGHESQSLHFLCIWVHACGRDGVTREIGARCTEPGFRGRELELEILCLRRAIPR